MEHEKRQTTNVQGSLRICNEYKKVPIIEANSADPDAASHQGLHCLPERNTNLF